MAQARAVQVAVVEARVVLAVLEALEALEALEVVVAAALEPDRALSRPLLLERSLGEPPTLSSSPLWRRRSRTPRRRQLVLLVPSLLAGLFSWTLTGYKCGRCRG